MDLLKREQVKYVFRPPRYSTLWAPVLTRLSTWRYLRAKFKVEDVAVEGADRVRELVGGGHMVLVAPNHADHADPHTLVRTSVITRSPFNADLAKTIPLINVVNERFKKHSGGRDLSDVPVRAFTGFMALMDAINRAGSTNPEKIRQALVNTNIPPDQLIVPWRGIKFGPDGHNTLSRGILMQAQQGNYCTIYPFELASCKVMYPIPSWKQKQ